MHLPDSMQYGIVGPFEMSDSHTNKRSSEKCTHTANVFFTLRLKYLDYCQGNLFTFMHKNSNVLLFVCLFVCFDFFEVVVL